MKTSSTMVSMCSGRYYAYPAVLNRPGPRDYEQLVPSWNLERDALEDYWGEKSEEKILYDLKMHLILSEGLRLQLGGQF